MASVDKKKVEDALSRSRMSANTQLRLRTLLLEGMLISEAVDEFNVSRQFISASLKRFDNLLNSKPKKTVGNKISFSEKITISVPDDRYSMVVKFLERVL